MTVSRFTRRIAAASCVGLFAAGATEAATFARDDDQFINVGTAFRTSFTSVEDGAPDGTSRSKDFALEEARLYLNGKVHKNVSFELNLARDAADNKVEVLDAHVGLELNDQVNVWVGRFLPPGSRASAAAPAYPPTFDFPLVEQAPNQFGGRDDGVALWGAAAGQKLKYQVGAFQGRKDGPNRSDSLSYATRLQYNFWDPEPGFYNLASYDGSKAILSVGASLCFQKDGAGTAAQPGDYRYWNVDGRLEKGVGDGAVAGAEASYYHYDNGGTRDPAAPAGKDGAKEPAKDALVRIHRWADDATRYEIVVVPASATPGDGKTETLLIDRQTGKTWMRTTDFDPATFRAKETYWVPQPFKVLPPEDNKPLLPPN